MLTPVLHGIDLPPVALEPIATATLLLKPTCLSRLASSFSAVPSPPPNFLNVSRRATDFANPLASSSNLLFMTFLSLCTRIFTGFARTRGKPGLTSAYTPTTWPMSLIPKGRVVSAAGKSNDVKTPPLRKKPCTCPASFGPFKTLKGVALAKSVVISPRLFRPPSWL